MSVSLGFAAPLTVGLVIAAAQAAGLAAVPVDLMVYIEAEPATLYTIPWSATTYAYPPPLAQVFAVAGGSPLVVFAWQALCWAAFAYVGRWLSLVAIVVGLAWIAGRVYLGPPSDLAAILIGYPLIGNVMPITAAITVLGLRYPALWALPLLTKVGHGVGVVWFAARGEWRNLAIALGVTAGIALVSFVLLPDRWLAYAPWVLAQDTSTDWLVRVPFPLRLGAAAAFIAWGARTDRAWTVPIAVGIAAPALYMWSFLPIWFAALSPAGRPGARRWWPGGR